ncbi:MAG: hypothetical protein HPY69_04670 [Armatimonadetes bacterium]|nr:hypothetical protein [Armatimonadota bacterium]
MTRRLLLALVSLAVLCTPVLAAGGLLVNPDFSERAEGDAQGPAAWTLPDSDPPVYAVVDDDGYSGAHSLRYTARAAGPAEAVTQTIACSANTDYVLTAALKCDGTVRPLVRVFAPDLDREAVRIVGRGDDSWQLFVADFNSGAATRLRVELYGDHTILETGQAVVGTSGLDDVQIYAAADVPEAIRPADPFVAPGPNIALGKPYALRPAPNYSYCTDEGDSTQLTDGERTVGYFWVQKTTVGWTRGAPVIITVNLGQVEPIAGVSYNTAAGVAGVAWPSNILVMVSDDGQSWTLAGDLMLLATEQGMPAPDQYAVHRFATDALRTRGRYVSFAIDSPQYIFCDEIEVYRGSDELLAVEPPGQRVDDPAKLFQSLRMRNAVVLRLRTDLSAARESITQTQSLDEGTRRQLEARADELAQRITALPSETGADLQTIFPMNELQAEIYALHAPLHRARGLSGVVAWQKGRWDPLEPTEAPAERPPLPELNIAMMRREYRAEAFCVTNCTDEPLTLTVNIVGLPGGRNPSYVKLREVLFTDTREMRPIAAALPEARQSALGYKVSLPAGMTRQLWVELRPLDLDAGEYRGQVTLQTDGSDAGLVVPLTLKLYPLDFPSLPSVSVGGWDYLNGGGAYDAGSGNMAALIETLTEHYVDTPWGTAAVQPNNVQFGPEGELLQVSFDNWDEWVGKWPGARHYAVFLAEDRHFYGEVIGTPRFNRMVGEWITAWVEHMDTQGLRPEQLLLLIYDEPGLAEGPANDIIAAWGNAINAAQPGVVVWEDPCYEDPAQVKPAVFAACDALCPNMFHWMNYGKGFQDFYLPQQAAGKDLYFYSCSGPGKLLDPIYYHRAQFWWALQTRARGSFYWAFGDEGGGSSFRAYTQGRTQYSPLFITPTEVVTGKHMEAIREGAQDYEYFGMLRARVAELEQQGVSTPLVVEAKALLQDLPVQVTSRLSSGAATWHQPDKDRDFMDAARLQALEMLARLQ